MKHCLENIDSIIFDLDGTLWDSTNEVVTSWNLVMEKDNNVNKVLTIEELKGYMGLPLDEIRQRMLPEMDEREAKELMSKCCEIENKHLTKHGVTKKEYIEKYGETISLNLRNALRKNAIKLNENITYSFISKPEIELSEWLNKKDISFYPCQQSSL